MLACLFTAVHDLVHTQGKPVGWAEASIGVVVSGDEYASMHAC